MNGIGDGVEKLLFSSMFTLFAIGIGFGTVEERFLFFDGRSAAEKLKGEFCVTGSQRHGEWKIEKVKKRGFVLLHVNEELN